MAASRRVGWGAGSANAAGKRLKAEAQRWWAPRPHVAVLYPSVGRVPLDAPPVWADPPAHRATHVASGLIERTAHGGSEARGGAIPVGRSQRAVLRGGI